MAYYKNSNKRNYWIEQISTSIKTKPSTVDDSESNSKQKNKLCIVAVPSCFFKENPEAYKPQKLGLGPYHHFRAEVFKMEWEKVSVVRASLNEDQINNFDVFVVDKLKDLYVSIQEHYGNFFDMDVNTFAWMFAIDGLFLLVQLYHMQKEFVSDIMMLENQIPFQVLKALQTYVSVKDNEDDGSLSSKLVRFCEAVSPLELAKESQIRGGASCQLHLLDLLYELIINKVSNEQGNCELLSRKKKVACVNNIKASVREKFLSCFSCRSLLGQIKFMTSTVFGAAWHMFSRKDEDQAESEKINAQEIRIPCVSLLHDVMNVEFIVVQGGISSIKFNKEHLIFYLPTIIVNENTEVILRNLVAYEATRMKSCDILQFSEYVDLMCGIIDKPRDVELLRKRNIVKVQDNGMDDEEIANLFNGIKESTWDRKREHGLGKAVAKVNERFLNSAQFKVYQFMQKHVYNSWKFLTFCATVLILIFTGFQSFCNVYGCSDHFFAE